MLIKEYITNRFRSIEQFNIGLLAVKGKRVAEIAEENEVSRKYVYKQKDKMEEQIEEIKQEITEERVKEVRIDDNWIKKAVILLALACSASGEGIQNFIETMLGIHVSIGTISNILKEASERAKQFDETISLESIKVGANDEIFQCNEPILTGIDPKTTYIYLMTASEGRTGEAWAAAFEKAKEAGLNLEESVNDGGSGLNKGIPIAFPGIKIQADVFHAEHDIGKAVSASERKAMNAIKEEAELEKKLEKEKIQNRTYEKYEKVEAEAREAIRVYDIMNILYMWLRELLNINGYEINEVKELIEYVLKEMENICNTNNSLKKGVKFIREHMDELLLFSRLIEERVNDLTKLGISEGTCKLMLEQLRYGYVSVEYNQIEAKIGEALGERYAEIKKLFNDILNDAVRASSMVENINGRLRVYMNLKRIIPSRFLDLLKVYFNTKKYRRSRCKERIGKSPLDLLTGQNNPDILKLLGY